MTSLAFWNNNSKKLFRNLLVSALLGVLVIPFPGLARIVLDRFTLYLPLGGLFVEFMFVFFIVLVPERFWTIDLLILKVDLPKTTMRIKETVTEWCAYLASTYVGLSIGCGFLYQLSPNSTLLNTCLLSLYCALWFLYFCVFASPVDTKFFNDFPAAEPKKKRRAQILAAIGLAVAFYFFWVYILH